MFTIQKINFIVYLWNSTEISEWIINQIETFNEYYGLNLIYILFISAFLRATTSWLST